MPDNHWHWQPNSNTRGMSMPASSGRFSEDLINAAVFQLRQGMSEEQSELDQGDEQSELDRAVNVFFNADDFLQLKGEGGQYESRFFRPLQRFSIPVNSSIVHSITNRFSIQFSCTIPSKLCISISPQFYISFTVWLSSYTN
jgi:hypothetical protein